MSKERRCVRASVRVWRYAPVFGREKVRVCGCFAEESLEDEEVERWRPRPPPPFKWTAEEPPVAARVPVAAVDQEFARDEEPGEDAVPGRE